MELELKKHNKIKVSGATLTDGCIIYERLGEDRVKMVRSNTA